MHTHKTTQVFLNQKFHLLQSPVCQVPVYNRSGWWTDVVTTYTTSIRNEPNNSTQYCVENAHIWVNNIEISDHETQQKQCRQVMHAYTYMFMLRNTIKLKGICANLLVSRQDRDGLINASNKKIDHLWYCEVYPA